MQMDPPSPAERRQFNVRILHRRRRPLVERTHFRRLLLLRHHRQLVEYEPFHYKGSLQHFIERPEPLPRCCSSSCGWSPLYRLGLLLRGLACICLVFVPLPARLRHASSSPRAAAGGALFTVRGMSELAARRGGRGAGVEGCSGARPPCAGGGRAGAKVRRLIKTDPPSPQGDTSSSPAAARSSVATPRAGCRAQPGALHRAAKAPASLLLLGWPPFPPRPRLHLPRPPPAHPRQFVGGRRLRVARIAYASSLLDI